MEPPSFISSAILVNGVTLLAGLLIYGFVSGIGYAYDYVILYPDSLKNGGKRGSREINPLLDKPERMEGSLFQIGLLAKLLIAYGSILLIKSQILALLVAIILIYSLNEFMSMRVKGREASHFLKRYQFILAMTAFTAPINRIVEALSLTSVEEREEREMQTIEEMAEELEEDLEVGFQQIEEEEVRDRLLLRNIVSLSNKSAEEIMTPRVEMVALDSSMRASEVLEVAIECGFSRLPVYRENEDQIIGFLYIKDLIPFIIERSEGYQWQEHIREAYFVPGSKKIVDLLEQFREKRIHLALVVDEYGGIDGVVTLEDVLEEIVGEISDESDEE